MVSKGYSVMPKEASRSLPSAFSGLETAKQAGVVDLDVALVLLKRLEWKDGFQCCNFDVSDISFASELSNIEFKLLVRLARTPE